MSSNVEPSPPYHPAYSSAYTTSDSPQQSSQEAEDTGIDASLSWIPQGMPQLRPTSRLEKPVVIPRVGTASKLQIPLPFLRVYSHVLRAHDIHESDFLSMIDNLAVAQAASPPMKAVDTAGMVLGFVPYHWAQAAGFGIQVAAGVGTAGISAARTKAFFKKVNEMYLNPRGLKVSIKKDEDLVALLGLPANGPALGPSDMNREPIALRDRRMQILAPHIAPLTLEVPPPAEQRSVLDRISARQVSKRIAKQEKDFVKKFDKQSRKSEKRRRKGKEGYIIKVEAKQLEDIAKLQYLVIENLYG